MRYLPHNGRTNYTENSKIQSTTRDYDFLHFAGGTLRLACSVRIRSSTLVDCIAEAPAGLPHTLAESPTAPRTLLFPCFQ